MPGLAVNKIMKVVRTDFALMVPLGLLGLIALLGFLDSAWARAILTYLKELVP